MRRQVLSQIVFVTATAAFAFAANNASAALKTLHSFCNAANCTDGETPNGPLVMDASGNLYGTTEVGGKFNNGLVFKLIPNTNKTKYTEHILKNFCAKPSCADGSGPQAGLIMDVDGNLYGTTTAGGKFGGGAVFKMKPVTNGWTYAVIHSFCHDTNCTDGSIVNIGLAYAGQASGQPYDGSSPLFGTTYVGGANNMGAVYELSPSGSGWNFQVIHSYSSGFHGGELLVDSLGNLLGTTLLGGANSGGTLYKLAAGTWTETTLHNFGAEANFADGWEPSGRLLMDSAGNLFGTTGGGGTGVHCTATHGCGVVFERKANGNFKVLYDFCSLKTCKDGEFPQSGVIMDSTGNLLGTTDEGGTGPGGTVFSLDHANSWAESVIYDFCSQQNCTDGAALTQPLILDASGNLFGTTGLGGANGSGGTVFRLKP